MNFKEYINLLLITTLTITSLTGCKNQRIITNTTPNSTSNSSQNTTSTSQESLENINWSITPFSNSSVISLETQMSSSMLSSIITNRFESLRSVYGFSVIENNNTFSTNFFRVNTQRIKVFVNIMNSVIYFSAQKEVYKPSEFGSSTFSHVEDVTKGEGEYGSEGWRLLLQFSSNIKGELTYN